MRTDESESIINFLNGSEEMSWLALFESKMQPLFSARSAVATAYALQGCGQSFEQEAGVSLEPTLGRPTEHRDEEVGRRALRESPGLRVDVMGTLENKVAVIIGSTRRTAVPKIWVSVANIGFGLKGAAVKKRWLVCIATILLLSSKCGAATAFRSSGIITIDGVPHPYLAEGLGKPCIAVGLVFPSLFSDRIKQHVKFIFVDYKNSWEADAPPDVEKITMDRLVNEVDQVRQALGLEKVCVIGYSLPGLVALEYLLRHPERVSHGILLGVPPTDRGLAQRRDSFWEKDASAVRKAAYQLNVEKLPDTLLQSLTPRDAFVFRYVRNAPRYFFDPSYDFYWAWAGRSFSLEVLNHYFKTVLADYDPRSRLSANTVPIFVAQGRYDYAVPYELWDEIRGKVPSLRYELFARSGHFVSIEEPGLFDQKLIRWLEMPTSMRK